MPGRKSPRTSGAALVVVALVLSLTLVLVPSACAVGKYKTLYTFKGRKDGSAPYAGLIFDNAGNLYGTTEFGGAYGKGTVFELTPNGNGTWTESVLHSFTHDGKDGYAPIAGLLLDPAGNLYGTTLGGGAYGNYGTVFQLTPAGDGSWTESVLHSFARGDGIYPIAHLIFDRAGALYGTTGGDDAYEHGTVFKLTRNKDESWTESVVHAFNGADGRYPWGGVIFDAAGNPYGTTYHGGDHDAFGTVFKLTRNKDESWTESVLHAFNGADTSNPSAGMIFDAAGNLYGTTYNGGDGGGTVFQLTPNDNGSWNERLLYSFNPATEGYGPWGTVIFDHAGNLYGTTHGGGSYGFGTIFKLKPTAKGNWSATALHLFRNQPGALPRSGLIVDGHGSLYGTTYGDGKKTHGSVFEISP